MEKPRVLLKISGEGLSGPGGFGYNRAALEFISEEINSVAGSHELGIVVGGGNIVRGNALKQDVFGEKTVVADHAGMLATVMNCIVLQEFLEKKFDLETRVMSAIEVNQICERHIVRKALSHLEKKRVIIFAGGTGVPGFSTDTAMVVRAHEIGAKIALKGTKVDGVYDKDPHLYGDAQLIPKLSHMEFLNRGLRIVDSTAVTQASDHGVEIRIFNLFEKGNLRRVLIDGDIGSVIH